MYSVVRPTDGPLAVLKARSGRLTGARLVLFAPGHTRVQALQSALRVGAHELVLPYAARDARTTAVVASEALEWFSGNHEAKGLTPVLVPAGLTVSEWMWCWQFLVGEIQRFAAKRGAAFAISPEAAADLSVKALEASLLPFHEWLTFETRIL